jgi:hypothetical protein
LRLDSGSNAPSIYGLHGQPRKGAPPNAQILKLVVEGVEQRFAVLPPQDLAIGREKIQQVSFVQPMNSVGLAPQPREDGVLPTVLFHRVFVSYRSQFAILEPR